MVKEVMPLSEEHGTAFVVALQDLDVPLGARVLVLVNSELTCLRDVFVDLDC